MHLVPELGGGQVVAAHLRRLTDSSGEDQIIPSTPPSLLSPGEAVELVLVPVGVEEEAHAAGEVGGGVAGGVVEAGPAGDSSREHGVGDHCDLEDDENDDS